MATSVFNTDTTTNRTKKLPLALNTTPQFLVEIKTTSGESALSNKSSTFKGFVTKFAQTHATRVSFAYTLGSQIYAYIYGDALWDIQIEGYGYIPCADTQKKSNRRKNKTKEEPATSSGYEELLEFYSNNNIYSEGKYCIIQLGTKSYKAYLVSADISSGQEDYCLFPFRFSFKAVESKAGEDTKDTTTEAATIWNNARNNTETVEVALETDETPVTVDEATEAIEDATAEVKDKVEPKEPLPDEKEYPDLKDKPADYWTSDEYRDYVSEALGTDATAAWNSNWDENVK